MVNLRAHVRKDFNLGTQQRGDLIVLNGGVRRVAGDAFEASAEVTGNETYFVQAQRDDDTLMARCPCRAFEDQGACKHLWAFLIAAEKRSLLAGSNDSAPRYLLPFGEDDPDYDPPPPPKSAVWRDVLKGIQTSPGFSYRPPDEKWPEKRQVYFVLGGIQQDQGVYVALLYRDALLKGGWGRLKSITVEREAAAAIPDPRVREVMLSLVGVPDAYSYSLQKVRPTYSLAGKSLASYLKRMCETEHCYYRSAPSAPLESWTHLEWDDGPPWRLALQMEFDAEAKLWNLSGTLERDQETMGLSEAGLLIEEGLVVARGRISAFDHQGGYRWAVALRKEGGRIPVPDEHAREFAFEAARSGSPPPIHWPEELACEVVALPPVPWLSMMSTRGFRGSSLVGRLRFLYGEHVANFGQEGETFADFENRLIVRRDLQAETQAGALVESLGLRQSAWYNAKEGQWELNGSALPKVIAELTARGWKVEAEGLRYRSASRFDAALHSGIDWFELEATADYDGKKVQLPELLKAIESGTRMVQLAPGEFGVVPDELLERYRLLAGLGRAEDGKIRFSKNQAGLLDVLLAARPEVAVDQVFAEARTRLHGFTGVQAPPPPEGFTGTLRGYQLEGLGWMKFLDEFALGGCLADDMGVGKTPQVLALLETRREAGAPASLIVVPRSLVYNWKQEAERFTPKLRVLDHTSTARNRQVPDFNGYDAVLATYGTVRRDAAEFRKMHFDYVILDEAQAIKNPSSESAKAARLLNGRRRLALSGTPVENHLGELWSLFEFLNPGMLGAAKAFKGTGGLKNPDEETRKMLARAIRPFLLRRTKEQVASELPPKQEQTIHCDLDPIQRGLYNELRDFYRAKLLDRVSRDGLAKSKIQVLEALLRLRQAACHPALLGVKYKDAPSAKLEVLMEQLREVMDEGHKALVFSQFTSFLAIVREKLDEQGVVYEYLDGQTRDRQARVERFQNSADCPLFLISLKAGGLGLNLTAADYVFLLDPWWNPAVEAQAIDRTHRIGQQRSVFAYRLIARDTVEEKVLELQSKKRDLAQAIVTADNSVIRDLKVEDLEALLS